MLHFAFKHDAAGLKASVRVVREACCDLMGRCLQLIEHQVGVEVSQGRSADRATYRNPRSIGYVCASHNLKTRQSGRAVEEIIDMLACYLTGRLVVIGA